MAAALLRRQGHAFAVILLLARLELRFRGIERSSGGGARIAGRDDGVTQLGQLALPREHAVQFAVGREQRDALRRDDVPAGGHEGFAARQRAALRERGG